MLRIKRFGVILLLGLLLLAGCNGGSTAPTPFPTATLAPLLSLTPNWTATPFITRTPPPTFTLIPSETPIPPTPTITPSLTATPPVVGIVGGMQIINVREGPSTNYNAIDTLIPGTAIQVLFQNAEGTWLNIRLEDGLEGWVSSGLIYIEATATPYPSMTPSPDYTALALGTPLPTALIGGGTVTATPPSAIMTATPLGTVADVEPTESFLPTIDVNTINMTATALAGGGAVQISPPPPRPTDSATEPAAAIPTIDLNATPTLVTPDGNASPESAAPTQADVVPATSIPTPSGDAVVRERVDVLAMCNNPTFRMSPPTDLAAGSTIEVFWAWFANDPDAMQQHIDAVTYEVRVNDVLLDWRQFGQGVIQDGDWYAKYWYVPVGPLVSGTYHITYRATWSETITDGIAYYGPNTTNPVEEGDCDFVVR
jgi:hypothetical protein